MKFRNLLIASALSCTALLPASYATAVSQADGIKINLKMYLQGALLGVKPHTGLMRDDLRAAKLIPLKEPYSAFEKYSHFGEMGGQEAIKSPDVLEVTGQDAIVDWVFVELRHPELQKIVLATRSALLQRDGDVVDVDGKSPVSFPGIEAGSYLVAVRHRNHLGVMAAKSYELSATPSLVDFTDPKASYHGSHPMLQISDKMALFAGDANQDGEVRAEGDSSDKDYIFFNVLHASDNVDANYNFILSGYLEGDINMDGQVKYQGPTSDGALLAFDIVFFWRYNCPQVDKDCRLVEELP